MTLSFQPEFYPNVLRGLYPDQISAYANILALNGMALEKRGRDPEAEVQSFLDEYWQADAAPKLNTIRRYGMRPKRVGDLLHLTAFPRNPRLTQMDVVSLTWLADIKIILGGMMPPIIIINDRHLEWDQCEQLAVEDGFDSIQAMDAWFQKRYGNHSTLNCQLISWEKDRPWWS